MQPSLAEFTSRLRESDDQISCPKQDYPRVTIVMPSYNQVSFIERSILSVLNQHYPNLDFIIIDGGSTDGSLDVIQKYSKHLSYWVSEPDGGQSDALNKGYAHATGDIFGWLNSDDLYSPGAIENAVAVLIERADKKIVFGDWLAIDEEDRCIAREYAFPMSINQTKYEGVSINAQAMFWRREVHVRFGGFEQSLYNTMDYQMVLAFALNEGERSFLCVPEVLGCFRRYAGQKTGAKNTNRQLGEHRWLAEYYGYSDKYSWVGKTKRFYYRMRRGYWYVKRAGFPYVARKFLTSQEMTRLIRP